FLREEVIDAEDRVFREHRVRDAVERPRRREVAPEGLLHDDARVLREARGAEALDHPGKERRGNGEIVRGAACLAERRVQLRESGEIVVVALHVVERREHAPERAAVVHLDRGADRLLGFLAQVGIGPLRGSDAHDGDIERAALRHGVERGKDLLVGQVAGDTEHHQRIGARSAAMNLVHALVGPGGPCRVLECAMSGARAALSAWIAACRMASAEAGSSAKRKSARSSQSMVPCLASASKFTISFQYSEPKSTTGMRRSTFCVCMSVSTSNISSSVPNPPGNTTSARASSANQSLRMKK